MCGLAGILNSHRPLESDIRRMTGVIAHRGPDDVGFWIDATAGIALGHRRLAIIDTSAAGHQPMLSADGRYVLAFNGEIYNHLDLREELKSQGAEPAWRGHSDTETLLAGIMHWGLADTLRKCRGMFALALWDRRQRQLQLARDRLGEKPLYFGAAGNSFVFGSELKAIAAHPEFRGHLCRSALANYLRFGYVPSPRSIWERIYKLEPGCLLTSGPDPVVPAEPLRPGERHHGLSVERFWSLAEVTDAGAAAPLHDEPAALDRLESTLEDAVRRQMLSDVPLGAFLSGGIDSSLIVALMQKNSAARVKTFTVGFDEREFDESAHAAAVARHLGTEHSEIRITAAEARAAIPRVTAIFDEPFADASQLPTFLICQAARPHVAVALTGDGGDEIFGGYTRYQRVPSLWNRLEGIPFPARRGLGAALAAVPPAWWDAVSGSRPLRHKPRVPAMGDRMQRFGSRLASVRSLDDLYFSFVSSLARPDAFLAVPGNEPVAAEMLADPLPRAAAQDPVVRMMYLDALTYMPDDILCKVDRCAMSVSLETRAPLLDPRVVELAAQMPIAMKLRGAHGKWALRQILDRHVPRALIERPKLGFFLPIGQWLRGPLRDWAEALLSPSRLAIQGVLAPLPVARLWQEHVSGRRDHTLQVWTVLMFQVWAEGNL